MDPAVKLRLVPVPVAFWLRVRLLPEMARITVPAGMLVPLMDWPTTRPAALVTVAVDVLTVVAPPASATELPASSVPLPAPAVGPTAMPRFALIVNEALAESAPPLVLFPPPPITI